MASIFFKIRFLMIPFFDNSEIKNISVSVELNCVQFMNRNPYMANPFPSSIPSNLSIPFQATFVYDAVSAPRTISFAKTALIAVSPAFTLAANHANSSALVIT
ncbi:MAG: hypothetical protein KIG97_04500 [Fibrobacter sp.]|uniref:hypothetical protein n=1 Tax=Fibrobacter sp. TaxID=35828 RepID=UPI0025B9A733|nr:hypothetical protein [Fibrobacter sp.]MBS7271624.1 hypothetical protein [Fibrobacter sp.]